MFSWILGSVSIGDVVRAMLDMSTRWGSSVGATGRLLKVAAILGVGALGWTLTANWGETLTLALIAALSLFAAGRVYRARK
jgi:hypothetical protein